jgi:hypothetical protein
MFLTSILLLGFSGVPGFGSEEVLSLDQQLQRIRKEAEKTRDVQKAETDCLALLRTESASEDKGRVHYEIAEIYYRVALIKKPEKALEYAKKALEFPLELPKATDMYEHWGSALYIAWGGYLYDPSISPPADIDWDKRNRDFGAMRKEVAGLYMTAEKLLLDAKVPRERIPEPAVGTYLCDSDDESLCEELERQHDEQMAARKKADSTNELVRRRLWFEGELVSMYSHQPYATTELRRLGLARLKEKKLVEDLVSRVKANIAQVGKSVQESAGTPSK